MVELVSNQLEAQGASSTINNSLSGLQSGPSVSLDGVSTVAGNGTAKHWIAEVQALAQQVSTVVQGMSTNINSVASAFDVMDVSLGQDLRSSQVSLGRLMNFND